MLLNKYRIFIYYKEVTVYAYRYAIPYETHIDDMLEYLKSEFSHAENFKIERITRKKVDLDCIDMYNDKTIHNLKLQFVKHQIEKGLDK